MTGGWRERQRARTAEMGDLAAAVYRQPWRLWKNRQRRRRMGVLLAEADAEDVARRERAAEFREAAAAAQRRHMDREYQRRNGGRLP